jgi:hypothetical protein
LTTQEGLHLEFCIWLILMDRVPLITNYWLLWKMYIAPSKGFISVFNQLLSRLKL